MYAAKFKDPSSQGNAIVFDPGCFVLAALSVADSA